MAKFMCPFCLNKYNIGEVQYVCPSCQSVSKPGMFKKEPVKCKGSNTCGGYATLRKCPKCANEIPKTALETKSLPFSIIGVAASGKTNYITVMLHELGRSSGLRLALSAQNKETSEHQNENYKSIYEEARLPEGTAQGIYTPQIWCVKNLSKRKGDTVPTYTFTIFDGAGEEIENMDTTAVIGNYIEASESIILVLDPLLLENVRKGNFVSDEVKINSLAGKESEYKNATDVVNRVADFIKNRRGIKSGKKLDIPVAVVLSKFDIVLEHPSFADNATVKLPTPSIESGNINLTAIREADQEIRGWLEDILEHDFIDAVDSHFSEFYFFGVSSFGNPPIDAYTLNNNISPHRVLDPILWLFKKADFVD